MTRFARAKGSKASNERTEEKATSWTEMQGQLNAVKSEADGKIMQKEADAKRKQNYDNFLKEVEAELTKNNVWADFPELITMKGKKGNQIAENKASVVSGNSSKEKKGIAQDSDANNVKSTGKAKGKKASKAKEKNNITKEVENETNDFTKKRKRIQENGASGGNKQQKIEDVTPKKTAEEVAEDERKKFEKKKAKQLRELERKKMKKQLGKGLMKAQDDGGAPPQQNQAATATAKQEVKGNKGRKAKKPPKPPKVKKIDPTKEPKRRKPMDLALKIKVDGKDVDLMYFDGYPIKRADAERLTELRKEMIAKGLPRSEVKATMKLERRRAEKAVAREKRNLCFNCRQGGHVLSECPAIAADGGSMHTAASGICFKCGSTEHTHLACRMVKSQEYRYASCFICKEQGHISRQCPDNARGLYPNGGACKLCGDVTHLKKDCPTHLAEQSAATQGVDSLTVGDNPDSLAPRTAKLSTAMPRANLIKF